VARKSSLTTSCDILPLHILIAHVFSNLFCHRLRSCLVSFVCVVCVPVSYRIVYQGYYFRMLPRFANILAPGRLKFMIGLAQPFKLPSEERHSSWHYDTLHARLLGCT